MDDNNQLKDAKLPENTDCDFTASEAEIQGAVCIPGETKCINQWIHKCNDNGRWFKTGDSC